jgi:ribosomal protein L2
MRCVATVGQVGNLDHENQNIGKAAALATWASAPRSVA